MTQAAPRWEPGPGAAWQQTKIISSMKNCRARSEARAQIIMTLERAARSRSRKT